VQVSDLEEERRKLRLEVKFRAKYHGKTALEMGLTPEQLLLLEEYVEGIKGGRNPEERLVTQLQQRVRWASMFGGGRWQGKGETFVVVGCSPRRQAAGGALRLRWFANMGASGLACGSGPLPHPCPMCCCVLTVG
jgi:hypothetical protein